jgi:acetoin utilization deacetylase AcuC-like enzyme
MKRTGFLFDERYLLHKTGAFHPEVPERLQMVFQGIKEGGLLEKLIRIEGQPADMKWIEAVHERTYINRFENACEAGNQSFECPDNQMCCDTYEVARLAVGGVVEAARRVMAGEIDNAFCAVRPPGHHAESNRAMGFCYFNNVAVAARYLQTEWGVGKVGIVDFDVHHGNGTQQIFEHDPTVFYYSIHQHPSFAYPGTGREFEQGLDEGLGYTINSPVLPGRGDDEYRRVIAKDLLPGFEKFRPDAVIVSAGFDAHEDDEMSDMRLSTDGFSWIMKKIVEMAEKYAGGKLISVLEGGYALHRLPELAKNHVEILLNGG